MSRSRARTIVLAAVGLAIALAVAGLGFIFVFNPFCENHELARTVSPDARHVAIVYERQCGSSELQGVHVSMFAQGAVLRSWHMGNIAILRASKHEPEALPRIEWVDANKASLTIPARSEVLRSADRFDDVEIVQTK